MCCHSSLKKIPTPKKLKLKKKAKKNRCLFPLPLFRGSVRKGTSPVEPVLCEETFCWWWRQKLKGCRGIWRDGGDDVLAISASRHLSLTAWAPAPAPCLLHVGSPFWATPSLHWPGHLLEGCAGPNQVGSRDSAAWGGAEGGRWGRTCVRGSCALTWCWGWGRADVEGSRGRTGRGKSTPHWTYWKRKRYKRKNI